MADKLIGFVVRHGESCDNSLGVFRSWLDHALTKKGISQAHAVSDFLKSKPIKHIICSPLLRAFVTADIIAGPHKLNIYQHRGLLPWRLGIFSGLPKDQNQESLQLFVKNLHVCIPQGESLSDFEDRQFSFWEAALEMAHTAGLTLYVTHNSVITALVNMTDDDAHANAVAHDSIKPGGIGAIYFDGKHHRIVEVYGQAENAVYGGS